MYRCAAIVIIYVPVRSYCYNLRTGAQRFLLLVYRSAADVICTGAQRLLYLIFWSAEIVTTYVQVRSDLIIYLPVRSNCYTLRTGPQRVLYLTYLSAEILTIYVSVCSDLWMSYWVADIAKLRTGPHIFLNIRTVAGSEYRSWYNDRPRAVRSGVRIPVWMRFFALIQTGTGPHPNSYTFSNRCLFWG
jgi:hypothetical protein